MTALGDAFWSKVDRRGPDECWPWLESVNDDGYGQVWDVDRRIMTLAHRHVYRRCVEDIGPGQVGARGVLVRHSCDNPPCCNPAHLLTGTQLDNMRDMRERGRQPDRHGERNANAKLTAEDVAAIRASATGKYGERSRLAREYGISTGHVSKILGGANWTAA